MKRKENPGSLCADTVLRHLIGANLELSSLNGTVANDSRIISSPIMPGTCDFLIDYVSIHCAIYPSEALIQKCRTNIDVGLHPTIITYDKGAKLAEWFAEKAGLEKHINILDAVQYIAGSLHKEGMFTTSGTDRKISDLISIYNKIVAANETDPSLRIED